MITPDVQIGDAWASPAGREAKVEKLGKHHRISGDNLVVARLKTGAELVCELGNFVKRRALIERGGVRVGDVRAVGRVSTVRVNSISADGAICEHSTGKEWLLLSYLSALPLLERDGKPVPQ